MTQDVFKYAHELTWEEFLAERARMTPIIDRQGRLICSRDRKIKDREAWNLYRQAFIESQKAGIKLREEVIRSNNGVVVPMLRDGAPAPMTEPEHVDFMGSDEPEELNFL